MAESLVVKISADSSELSRELTQVRGRLDDLRSRVRELESSFQRAGSAAQSLGNAVGPLQNLGRTIERVAGQAESLSQMSIQLNVTPALNALSQLSQAIAAVAAQLQGLAIPGGGGGGGGNGGGRVPQGFANGGVVSGPVGLDRVPAWLTAGEFVLRPAAVEQLGVAFLQALNDRPGRWSAGPSHGSTGTEDAAGLNVTNHYGGITVQVSAGADVQQVLGELNQQQMRLTARRG